MQEKESVMVVRFDLKIPSLRLTIWHHQACRKVTFMTEFSIRTSRLLKVLIFSLKNQTQFVGIRITILMNTHKVCFYGDLQKIILKSSTSVSITGHLNCIVATCYHYFQKTGSPFPNFSVVKNYNPTDFNFHFCKLTN